MRARVRGQGQGDGEDRGGALRSRAEPATNQPHQPQYHTNHNQQTNQPTTANRKPNKCPTTCKRPMQYSQSPRSPDLKPHAQQPDLDDGRLCTTKEGGRAAHVMTKLTTRGGRGGQHQSRSAQDWWGPMRGHAPPQATTTHLTPPHPPPSHKHVTNPAGEKKKDMHTTIHHHHTRLKMKSPP